MLKINGCSFYDETLTVKMDLFDKQVATGNALDARKSINYKIGGTIHRTIRITM